MTAWHYTMHKCKTLRWLRSMQARHSPTKHIISPVKDTKVIYALYHIALPKRIYVGQTLNTAFKRFRQHIDCAKRFFRSGDTTGVEPFHRHLAYVGWQDFRIFPLEHIHGEFSDDKAGRTKFRQTALPRETFWKRVLHAFLPTGLCLEGKKPRRIRGPQILRSNAIDMAPSSVTHAPILMPENINRTYASRVYERKVRFLLHRASTGDLNTEHIKLHNTRNVRRMYDCLHEYSLTYWGVRMEHFNKVNDVLFQTLNFTVNEKRGRITQTVIVQLFLHKDIERLGINTIISDEEAWNNLVPRSTREHLNRPLLTYKFAQPISMSFCNYSKVSSMTTKDKHDILASPCQCLNPSFRKFQDKHTGHIITTDTSIMRNARLQNLMAKGTKFRCTVVESDLQEGEDITGVVERDLKRALNTWLEKIKFQFGEADASALQNWKEYVLRQSSELMRDRSILTTTTTPRNLPSDNDMKQLHFIQRHFVIITVDKAENNFCIMCKKFYLQHCLNELGHGVALHDTGRLMRLKMRFC